jgi:hypothetical protein
MTTRAGQRRGSSVGQPATFSMDRAGAGAEAASGCRVSGKHEKGEGEGATRALGQVLMQCRRWDRGRISTLGETTDARAMESDSTRRGAGEYRIYCEISRFVTRSKTVVNVKCVEGGIYLVVGSDSNTAGSTSEEMPR